MDLSEDEIALKILESVAVHKGTGRRMFLPENIKSEMPTQQIKRVARHLLDTGKLRGELVEMPDNRFRIEAEITLEGLRDLEKGEETPESQQENP
jgi:hypothetical protein